MIPPVHRLGRVPAMLPVLLVLLGLSVLTGAQPAAAEPQGQYAATLTFTVSAMTPSVVTATGPDTLLITGTMTNTGEEALTEVRGRIQRGDRFLDPAALQAEITEPGQPESVLTDFSALVDVIEPNATVPFSIQTSLFTDDGLQVSGTGVYPIMMNVNADFESGPSSGARVGELHRLLTVLSVPVPATDGATPLPSEGPSGQPVIQPVNLLIPVVDRPHRDPTGAFFDDDLATLIAPGGRLAEVLRSAEGTALPAGSVTLAVDPELLEELQLMRAGYTVGPVVYDLEQSAAALTTPSSTGTVTDSADPGTSQAATEDSTVPPTQTAATTAATTIEPAVTGPVPAADPTAVPGTGAAAAAEFLDRLQSLSTRVPVLVLPYGDIDAAAAVRYGYADQVTAAVSRGQALAAGILGSNAELITDMSWPIDGYVDEPTLTVLRDAGLRSTILDRAGVSDTAGSRATIELQNSTVPAVLSTAAVPDGAAELNTFAAVTAQNYFSAVRTATVFAPGRNWQPTTAGYPELTTLLGELSRAGAVAGAGLAGLDRADNDSTPAAATLDYPLAALSRELPAGSFDDSRNLVQGLAGTQSAFNPTDPIAPGDRSTTAPADLFVGIVDDMLRQAAGGFRNDPQAAADSAQGVRAVITDVQSKVLIVPPAGYFTLTSNTSPLLVTVRNDQPYTAHLRIRVDPDDARRAGITVSDIGVQTIQAGRTAQLLIPAEISRAGSLSLRVQLTTADGERWGPVQTLQLRSTAYGSFTVVLVVVAAVIVVLTSAGRIRKRYKQRRQRIEAGLQ